CRRTNIESSITITRAVIVVSWSRVSKKDCVAGFRRGSGRCFALKPRFEGCIQACAQVPARAFEELPARYPRRDRETEPIADYRQRRSERDWNTLLEQAPFQAPEQHVGKFTHGVDQIALHTAGRAGPSFRGGASGRQDQHALHSVADVADGRHAIRLATESFFRRRGTLL